MPCIDIEYHLSTVSGAPRVIPKLDALIKDPNMNPEDVVNLIRMDPHLSIRLLQACRNRIGGESTCSTQEALNILGFTEVYRMAVLSVLRHTFHHEMSLYEDNAETIWQRALVTALYAEEFASESDGPLNEAFTLGLLHFVGMFFLDKHSFNLPGGRIPTSTLSAQVAEEKRRFDVHFLDVTADALKHWGFQGLFCESIRHAAQPETAPGNCLAKELNYAVQLSKLHLAKPHQLAFLKSKVPTTTPCNRPIEPVVEAVEKRVAGLLRQL